MVRTLYNDSLARLALVFTTRTTNATFNGVAIDLGLFNNDFRTIEFVVATGVLADGTGAFTVEESVDGSTGWTVVPAARIQGALPVVTTGAPDDTVMQFGVIPDKQWLRIVLTTTAVTAGGPIGAIALMGAPSVSPPNRS